VQRGKIVSAVDRAAIKLQIDRPMGFVRIAVDTTGQLNCREKDE